MIKTWFKGFLTAFFAVVGGALGIVVVVFLLATAIFSSDISKPNIRLKNLPDHKGSIREYSKTAPCILHLSLEGVIGNGLLKEDRLELVFNRILNDVDLKNRVKGILLDINSPGGDVSETHRIYQFLCEVKERLNMPVYVFANGICASGGYYVACSADKIFGSVSSLVGSIGVISWPPFFNVLELLEKVGISSATVLSGKHKDDMNPFRPWKAEETVRRQEMVDFFYDVFIGIVAKHRSLITKEDLKDTYGAGVFTAFKAKEAGFIDEIVDSPRHVLATLAKDLSIEEDYQVLGVMENGLWKKVLKEKYFKSKGSDIVVRFLTGSAFSVDEVVFPCSYRYMP